MAVHMWRRVALVLLSFTLLAQYSDHSFLSSFQCFHNSMLQIVQRQKHYLPWYALVWKAGKKLMQ